MIRPGLIIGYLGKIVLIIGIAMLTGAGWSLYFGEDEVWRFLAAAGITIAAGGLASFTQRGENQINYREGFAIVTLGWLTASVFGSLPYLFSGYCPSFADAFFETVSGFTTTGSSVFGDVEALPKGLLWWRALTQWLGGMGILALFIAIMSNLGPSANLMFKAESPGPSPAKVTPRIKQTAKNLWQIYVVISAVMAVILYAFGMDIFDSLCHMFGAMSTGGFSTKNNSMAYFSSPYIQWTITVFMFISGTNFALHYFALRNHTLEVYRRNSEFKLYAFIVLGASAIVSIGIISSYSGFEPVVRTAFFQVVSIITTTGFISDDYDQWSQLAQGVIWGIILMGGCAGSTTGGIKLGRLLILGKRAAIEIKRMIHPRAVYSVRIDDKIYSEALVGNIAFFFFLYIMCIIIGTFAMFICNLDMVSGLSAVMTCLGNVGPGFGLVGPTKNFGFLSDGAKYILSLLMLLGRLEIYPILVMLIPQFWKE
ncbi:MAG TPA: potassium transporter [Syntrophomonas sp.]|nr:potassium transporter [Syntrophomonas sp.]HCF70205.1 potassium transporter [Syntrophomonas sp.]